MKVECEFRSLSTERICRYRLTHRYTGGELSPDAMTLERIFSVVKEFVSHTLALLESNHSKNLLVAQFLVEASTNAVEVVRDAFVHLQQIVVDAFSSTFWTDVW